MWWLGAPLIASAVKSVTDNHKESTDISERYQMLDKDSKGQLILALYESGVSQKRIANSLGISPSAISQRLKNNMSQPVNNTYCVEKLYELHHIGISNQAIAKILTTSDLVISSEDIESFFKVINASKLNLT
ncbi:hypothetical protein [Photobacterium damselae]|uniref:Uncharacterized protein n=1 Tax=Photobacterium damselae TaxID=38293 RepID=A0A2T3QH35_PHODM|nr:hypothetical protein [Photobacterium damselae]PSW83621.1 hypothetical protein CTN07_16495 [Photobacterium damselae]SPY28255.1 Uncharacterised protein [Photobacterium damselae]